MSNSEIESIERDLAETRARTESTIEALQQRLQPRAVLDEATRFFRGTDTGGYAEDVTRNALAQARENPLPLLLVGAGAVLLATKRPGRPSYIDREVGTDTDVAYGAYDESYAPTYEDYQRQDEELSSLYDSEWEETHRIVGASETIDRTYVKADDEDETAYQNRLYEARGTAFRIERDADEDDTSFRQRIDDRLSRAKTKASEYGQKASAFRQRQSDKASGLYQRAGSASRSAYESGRARAGAAYGSAREGVSSFYDGTRQRSRDLAHGTADAARGGARQAVQLHERQPLATAALALLAGAVTGSLFGTTRQERQALGRVGDDLNEAARRLNETANQKVAEYARRVESAAYDAGDRVDEVRDQIRDGDVKSAARDVMPNKGETADANPTVVEDTTVITETRVIDDGDNRTA